MSEQLEPLYIKTGGAPVGRLAALIQPSEHPQPVMFEGAIAIRFQPSARGRYAELQRVLRTHDDEQMRKACVCLAIPF